MFRICCAVGVAGGALWAWTNRAHAAHVQAVWQPWFLAIGAGLLAGALIGALLAHLFRS